MKLFGRKSAGRAPARPVLSRGFGATMHGEWPRSYEGQARDAYIGNPVAQRAVRLVAEGVASAPLSASDPALLALVKATSGGQALMETLSVHLLLHGNAYVQILQSPDGSPCELFALRPERITVEPDVRGWPMAFLYRAGEAAVRLPADNVIHIRTVHPLDDHYGLGCLGAASGPVAIHNAATKWNKALLDNAARPSGALVYDPGDPGATLSRDQFDRLKAEMEANFSGAGNAGRPMLLEGGLKWQAMSLSPADMDFIALKSSAARDIALAFGVPPMLLGLPGDATYANYREANKALWRSAILPLTGKLLDALTQGLRPWFADAQMSVDLDQVGALSEDRERLWAQVNAAEFLTLDEKRALVGFAAVKRTNAAPPSPNIAGALEVKFNKNHDPKNGQFTFATGGSFGGGGAMEDFDGPTPPKKASQTDRPTKPTKKTVVLRGGGGSFGGGGAMGSWSLPTRTPPLTDRAIKPDRKPFIFPDQVIKPPLTARAPLKKPALQLTRPPAATAMRRISSGGYDFDIDQSDRTRRATGTLRLNPSQGRSKRTQRAAGGSDRLPSDHGGHYIARAFNGPKGKFNHFAQDAGFNQSEYRSLELHWGKLIKKGHKVTVDIRPRYAGHSQRPESLDVTYYAAGMRHYKSFPNKKKGN